MISETALLNVIELAMPSQLADSLAQMARRIASDPRTTKLAPQLRFSQSAHYRLGSPIAADATARSHRDSIRAIAQSHPP